MVEKKLNTLRKFRMKTPPTLPLASEGLDLSWVSLRPSDGLMFVTQPWSVVR